MRSAIEQQATAAWPHSVTEARLIQERLWAKVIARDALAAVRIVGAVDAWSAPQGDGIWAAAVALGLADLELKESAVVYHRAAFPCVPGFLSFREAPAALAALERLRMRLGLLLVDGHGLAHPRHFGLACHLGLLAAIPTIGVAKSALVGRNEEPEGDRGAWAPLIHEGETVGAALRTRLHTHPLFVSVGHRVSLHTAIDYVLRCTLASACPSRFARPTVSRASFGEGVCAPCLAALPKKHEALRAEKKIEAKSA